MTKHEHDLFGKRLYPKETEDRRRLDRRWRLDCDLAYDGGGSKWSKGYRTRSGARLAAWWHYHVASWGGSIVLVDTWTEAPHDRC